MKALIVDKKKLKNNINLVRERAGVPVIGVLKADGYGMGLLQLAHMLVDNGVSRFAVTEPDDALKLRQGGFTDQEILVMRSTSIENEIHTILEACATATIGSYDAAVFLNGIAEQTGTVVDAHVKVDTGMGRYGFLPSQFDRIQAVYTLLPNVNVTGLYTHFHSAFSNVSATREQAEELGKIAAKLREAKIEPGTVHAANSAALFRFDDMMMDAVRVGSAFTGRLPAHLDTGLERCTVLKSQVIETRWLPKHHSVGYGAGFVTRRPTQIAVVPVGYTDGFGVEKVRDIYRLRDWLHYLIHETKNFLTRKRFTVNIGQKRARVIGHIGLCHITLDVTGLEVNPGDTVTMDISPLYVNPSIEKIYE